MDLNIPSFTEIEKQYDAVLLAKNKATNKFNTYYEAIKELQSKDTPITFLRN